MKRNPLIYFTLLATGILSNSLPGQESIPEQAISILRSRCYRCHGGTSTSAGLDVLNRESLFGVRGNEQLSTQWIKQGESNESLLWDAIESEFMPLDDSPEAESMTAAERELIQKWIDAGADFPLASDRKPVTLQQSLAAVKTFLDQQRPEDREFFRFFSLTHLNNNPEVSDQELRFHRAALSKVLNSLVFRKPTTVKLQPVDAQRQSGQPQTGSIFALDLRELGWEQNQRWQLILDHYPYGVQHEFSQQIKLRDLYRDVRQHCGTDQPIIRGDWFVVYGSLHPLYTQLLELPPTLNGLQQRLGVEFENNILRGDVARAGFAKSGVSQQNRMIERHEGTSGYVWLSYDFKPRRAQGDLVRFPLGPRFPNNPFNRHAFEHDGGELIFRLPNGMQGYMLILSDGRRLDDPAPTEIVFDASGVTGSTAIRNGLSCMNCHSRGMIAGFHDDVRQAHAVGGEAQQFLEKIYPSQDRMDGILEADRESYLTAERRVTGPYLAEVDIGEPVGKVAQRYFANVDIETAARELGLSDGQQFQVIISSNPKLVNLGLGRFTQQPPSTIQRVIWESTDGLSYFQEIVSELQPGALPIAPAALNR